MKKVYHLSSCSTCQRILKELDLRPNVELQDIKEKNIDVQTLDWLKEKIGSYEALFSKKAMKYRSMGLHEKDLSEAEYRKYLLEEYTFLKRPFIINNESIFVGNSKDTVARAKDSFQQS